MVTCWSPYAQTTNSGPTPPKPQHPSPSPSPPTAHTQAERAPGTPLPRKSLPNRRNCAIRPKRDLQTLDGPQTKTIMEVGTPGAITKAATVKSFLHLSYKFFVTLWQCLLTYFMRQTLTDDFLGYTKIWIACFLYLKSSPVLFEKISSFVCMLFKNEY